MDESPQKDVEVRIYGSHRRLLGAGNQAFVPHVPGETVKSLLNRLNIPEEEVWLVVVNDVQVSEDYVVRPGDVVAVMSPVAGG